METTFDLKEMQRTPVGLVAKKSTDFMPLLNYPVRVEMTSAAIQKMDLEFQEHDNMSQIEIDLNFKSGKKWHLFTINTNFFGRVQGDLHLQERPIGSFRSSRDGDNNSPVFRYTVGTFEYDPSDKSYRFDWTMERTLDTLTNKGFSSLDLPPNDVMVSFSATYTTGCFNVSSRTNFLTTTFEDPNAPEELLLKIDTYLLDSPNPDSIDKYGRPPHRDETGPKITLNHLSPVEQRKLLKERHGDVRDRCILVQKH